MYKFYWNDFYVKTEFIPILIELSCVPWKILTIQFCFDFLQFAYSHHCLKEKFKQENKKKNRQIVADLNLPKDEIKAGGYSDQAIPIIIEQEPTQSDNER